MFWIKNIGIRYRVPGIETSREPLAYAREKLCELTGKVHARGAMFLSRHTDLEQALRSSRDVDVVP
jgi:hypothetical protein